MGPKLAVVTPPPPPRSAPPSRQGAGGGDAPSSGAFGSVLDQQAAPPAGGAAKGPDVATGEAVAALPPPEALTPAPTPGALTPSLQDQLAGEWEALQRGAVERLDPDSDKADGASAPAPASADAMWQALLAQVLSTETGKAQAPKSTAPEQGEALPRPANQPLDAAGPTDDAAAAPAPTEQQLAMLAANAAEGQEGASRLPSQAAQAAFAALAAAPGQKGKEAPAGPETGAKPVEGQPIKTETGRAEVLLADAVDEAAAAQTGGTDDGADLGPTFERRMRAANAETAGVDETRTVAVRNVSTTTHYPVVNDPVRQVAGEIVREVRSTMATSAPAEAQTTQPNAARTLNIQLEPEALGTVNVKMRLSNGALSIQIEVARPETLDMMTRGQDALQRSLQTDQCQVDTLTIRAAAPTDSGGLSQGNQNANQNGGSSSSAQQGSDSSRQQEASTNAGDRSPGQRGHERSSGRPDHDETVTHRDRAASPAGLYL